MSSQPTATHKEESTIQVYEVAMSKDTCEENKPTSTCFLLLQDCGSAASDEEAAPRYMPAGISRSHEYCSV